jgi:hypothetical protein
MLLETRALMAASKRGQAQEKQKKKAPGPDGKGDLDSENSHRPAKEPRISAPEKRGNE